MDEAIERFWARIASDASFREALTRELPGTPTPEDLAGFATRAGFPLDAAAFVRHARNRAAAPPAPEEGELSLEALEAVSGAGSEDSYASDPLEMDIYATWDAPDTTGTPGAADLGKAPGK